jgi:hypothetical protein
MKPIFFPFTFISESTAEALTSCFRRIVVYQACHQTLPEQMLRWAQAGILEVRIPIDDGDDKLFRVVKDFKIWAQFHQGGMMEYLKVRGPSIPFFDDTWVSQIRSAIKKGALPWSENERPDPAFLSRLFLYVAQEYDEQNFGLRKDLEGLSEMEQQLMQNLKGELNNFEKAAQGEPAEDPGSYMPTERIAAWTRLLASDRLQQGEDISALFITNSKAVFEQLAESTPEAKSLSGIKHIPVLGQRNEDLGRWQERLSESLGAVVNEPYSGEPPELPAPPSGPEGSQKISLSFLWAIGETPSEFFSRIGGLSINDEMIQVQRKKCPNTLIGLVS